jgi:segregation and condensation protein B
VTGDERRETLADQAAAWVPPWERPNTAEAPESDPQSHVEVEGSGTALMTAGAEAEVQPDADPSAPQAGSEAADVVVPLAPAETEPAPVDQPAPSAEVQGGAAPEAPVALEPPAVPEAPVASEAPGVPEAVADTEAPAVSKEEPDAPEAATGTEALATAGVQDRIGASDDAVVSSADVADAPAAEVAAPPAAGDDGHAPVDQPALADQLAPVDQPASPADVDAEAAPETGAGPDATDGEAAPERGAGPDATDADAAPETGAGLDAADAADGGETTRVSGDLEPPATPEPATTPALATAAQPATDAAPVEEAEPRTRNEPPAEAAAPEAGDAVDAHAAAPDAAALEANATAALEAGAAAAEPATEQQSALALIDDAELKAALEAILLVVDEPVTEIVLAQILEQPTDRIAATLVTIAEGYTAAGHGFDLRKVAGGWRLYTRPEYAPYVERFVLDGQSVRLTQAALETLAVVAYKQPVTRSRISAIRGVNCDGVIRTLVSRGLVEECGTEPESGAFLYRTTTLFLEKLGMNSVNDLPPLAPFLPDDVEEVADANQ